MAKKRGRPQKHDDFLALEVIRVMRTRKCGVRKACKIIAQCGDVPLQNAPWKVSKRGVLSRVKPTARWVTKERRWQGMNAGTLEQTYFRWLRREEKRQAALKIEI